MRRNNKQLVVVGDRVLVRLDDGEDRSKVGLYLPATAMDNQAVQAGQIVATGAGAAYRFTDELAAARGPRGWGSWGPVAGRSVSDGLDQLRLPESLHDLGDDARAEPPRPAQRARVVMSH
jgi:hypothetical protein